MFFAKVVTILFCIAATLAPLYIAVMFCYGFYHDYLRSPNKADKTRANTSA